MGVPSSRDQAMLGQISTQGVDHPGALANKHLSRAKQHRAGLLLFRLHRDEAHGWTQRCLDNRLGIGSIVLVTLDEGLHMDRRDQAGLMFQLPEFVPSAMGVAQASMTIMYPGCRATNASS